MRRTVSMAIFAIIAAAGLAGCGKSEGEIRAEERARIFEDMIKKQEQACPSPAAAPQAAPAASSAPVPAGSGPGSTPAAQQRSDNQITVATPEGRLIGSYSAYIGDADLFNSSGTRLTQPWAILRQDRANFHRFGVRQGADQPDTFFTSEANRAIMERMLRNGKIDRSAAQQVVRGNALVLVEIFGTGNRGEYLHVSVN